MEKEYICNMEFHINISLDSSSKHLSLYVYILALYEIEKIHYKSKLCHLIPTFKKLFFV